MTFEIPSTTITESVEDANSVDINCWLRKTKLLRILLERKKIQYAILDIQNTHTIFKRKSLPKSKNFSADIFI